MRVGSFAVLWFPVKGCRMLRLLRAGKPLPLLLVLLAVGVLPAGASAEPVQLFTFRDPQIAESSGIVASATRDDVVFTHNDSGDTARFFAVDRYGCTVGVFTATGVEATDWEDMARGPAGSLWLGDIGDNNAERDEIAVQRFDEPAVGASTNGSGCPPAAEQAVTAASYRLRFEDGPHDAETLLVDPRTSQVFIITKSFAAGALYAAPNPLKTDDVNVLRKVADVGAPAFATGGDIAPDGKSVAVRNYWEIDIRSIPDGNLAAAFAADARVQRLDAPDSGKQGEGLGFTRTGRDLLTSSEGASAPVFLIPLANGGPTSTPTNTTSGPGTTAADTTAPRVTAATLSRRRFRAASRGPSTVAAAAVGTTISYTLSEPATSRFRVQRRKGRRYVTLRGRFKHAGNVRRNHVKFTGRLRGRKLRPGRYRLVMVAIDSAANESPRKRLTFRIVR
jgi:hypothetical protein